MSDFLAALRTGDDGRPALTATSAARTVVAVRGWHRFLAREGVTPTDPSDDVRPPQAPKRLPKAISVDEVRRLLEAAAVGDTPGALRDRALLEVLYATGARISEAVGLDLDDLPPQVHEGAAAAASAGGAAVRLLGKGGKERVVPLGSYAVRALQAYVVRARPVLATSGAGGPAVFLNTRGGRLSRQSAWTVLRAAADRARPDRPRLAAHAAALVRHPPARGRRRRAGGAGAARPRLGDHHAGLHAGDDRPAPRGLRRGPPAGALR